MATITVDLIEGSAASHDTLKGWDITRTAIVKGIVPVSLTGTLTSASDTVSMASTAGVAIGQIVTGTGIPTGASVGSIVVNTSIGLVVPAFPSGFTAAPATASGAKFLTFGPVDTASLIQTAINAVIAVVGDRTSQCPNVPVPTFLQAFVPTILSADVVMVAIKYKGYPLPVFEFDSNMNQVPTNKDINGNNITVQYTYPATQDFQFDPRLIGTTQTQGGLLSLPVPEPIYAIKWLVMSTPTHTTATLYMDWLKATYEGKINNAPWAFITGGISYPKHSALIEKVSGRTSDGGLTYEATMVFHVKPTPPGGTSGGWDPQATYINAGDGMPPPDVVAATGYNQFQILPEVTFPTFATSPN